MRSELAVCGEFARQRSETRTIWEVTSGVVGEVEATGDAARTHDQSANEGPPFLALSSPVPVNNVTDIAAKWARHKIEEPAESVQDPG